jgi:hypothetical protein
MAPSNANTKGRLAELAARTCEQLRELDRDLSPDRCDWMQAALRELSDHIDRLRIGLLKGSPPEGR